MALKEVARMALGKRTIARQESMWIATHQLPRSPGHPFYQRLNQVLARHKFDAFAEEAIAQMSKEPLREVVADKGYHSNASLIDLKERGVRVPQARDVRAGAGQEEMGTEL